VWSFFFVAADLEVTKLKLIRCGDVKRCKVEKIRSQIQLVDIAYFPNPSLTRRIQGKDFQHAEWAEGNADLILSLL
jgi:hypothetical protein